ncbi:protein BREAST CANCER SUSCEPTIBILITY 1 homolog isoform X1 [Primulina huaijiensis]|uniref:protein BREAST CANCER SUSCEPTIBILITY 1 homolog isoform X1 n=2 Tax=Primulina huaijiensis TaxID=1492673 RepID=UPI003CC6F627
MADASHLERMGRELNCPICLSLLSSAVSLYCNHVFCNSCIEKSMKSASNCPVCKVPYRRREIRPAPHMDNLVSVYRNMEVAMGVNIFVTQTAASTKISGAAEDNRTGANTCVIQDKGESHLEPLDCKNQELHLNKRSKWPATTNQGDFASAFGKPSFPTKKRVQVPSTTEMHRQPGMLEERIGETVKKNPEGYPLTGRNTPVVCEKGQPVFTPFFWLREEEDIEKSTQQSYEDELIGTPLDAPCFSDIKDSDDERANCNTVDLIDSEMFDWTQRPCSPELCSSPAIMQIEDNMEHPRCQEGIEASYTETTTSGSKIHTKRRKGLDKTHKIGKLVQNKSGTANKTFNKLAGTRGIRRNKKTVHEVEATCFESNGVNDESMLKSDEMNYSLNTSGISGKNKKVVCSDIIVQEVSDKVSTLLNETGPLQKRRKTAFDDSLVSKHHQRDSKLKSVKGNKIRRTSGQLQKLGGRISTQKVETGNNVKEEGPCNEVLISNTDANFSRFCDKKEFAGQGMPNMTCEESCNETSKSSKKVKFLEGTSNNSSSITLESLHEVSAMRGRYLQENNCNSYQPGMEVVPEISKTPPTPNRTPLKKCKMLSAIIHCSFCQSSEDSVASGPMVKYYNGKLVTDSQAASSKIIHVHKNCTEWAPNVYFEGDNVINLEAELSRSHKIRCCCCGIKGAALGCYEKICRKSFHIPCARLTPECRWDNENFVILCPLHASHQLPNEDPESQTKQRRKMHNKSLSNVHQPNITSKCESSTIIPWKFEKRLKNLVLCCSAITNIEKGIISEFQKLSGVRVLKNWDLSVTHVIASTDENGACRRTLKVLMGMLEGKWILSLEWIKACLNAKEFVEEQQYEITCDIHGIRNGPRLGRLRLLNKQPKLFNGCKFYFTGDFAPSYKGYLHDLAIAAGGKVLNRKPVGEDHSIPPWKCYAKTYIVYNQELPENCKSSEHNLILKRRLSDAEALASSTGATAASNSWILNSIAGHKLQNLG